MLFNFSYHNFIDITFQFQGTNLLLTIVEILVMSTFNFSNLMWLSGVIWQHRYVWTFIEVMTRWLRSCLRKSAQSNNMCSEITLLKLLPHLRGPSVNTLRPRQNGRHFADDIFKCIFLNGTVWILIKISLKFVLMGPINNISALV